MTYQEAIDYLLKGSNHIRFVAIISSDGLMLASNISGEVNKDKLAALSAAIVGLAKRSAQEMSFGHLNVVAIQGTEATYLVYSIDDTHVMTIITATDPNIGMVSLLARDVIAKLKK